MRISRISPLTGKKNTMDLPVSLDQLLRWMHGGMLIQDAFPHLTPAEREFIKSGYIQADWDAIFPPEEPLTTEPNPDTMDTGSGDSLQPSAKEPQSDLNSD
jgi:hypothetical protein